MTILELFKVLNVDSQRIIIHRKGDDPIKDWNSALHSKTFLSVIANEDITEIKIETDAADIPYLYIEITNI